MTERDSELLLGTDVQKMIRKWSNRYTRNRHDFEDVAQDAHVAAILYMDRHGDRPRDQDFLFRLNNAIRGKIGGDVASRARYHEHFVTVCGEHWRGFAVAREDGGLSPETRDLLDQIPSHQRAPILLHFCEGRSHAEVGRILGRNHAAIKQRIIKGLRRLRVIMGAAG